MIKYYLLSIILFLSSFTTCVYASEPVEIESTDEYYDSLWHKGMSNMQDVLDNIPLAMSELRDTATSFGVAADATVQTLVNAPVKAVMSNFLACSEDMIEECTNLLTSSREFMSSIFFNSIDKTFLWNDETIKIGHDILKDRFLEHYDENVPRGFYKADSSNPLNSSTWYVTGRNDAFFTNLTNGYALMCCTSGSSTYWRTNQLDFYSHSYTGYTYNGVFVHNAYRVTEERTSDNSLRLYPPIYSTALDALVAFYSFTPSSGTRPNGKGYFKPLPQNTIVKANGNNVYNNDWGDIIVNNYTTYGDTFENTVYNNYYYSSTNKDTPVYWYDIYSSPISISQGTYDDISNITLGDPNISTNNSFFTSIFNALPVALSTMIISLLILSIVILFLKG